jgi:hypothetical protein
VVYGDIPCTAVWKKPSFFSSIRKNNSGLEVLGVFVSGVNLPRIEFLSGSLDVR